MSYQHTPTEMSGEQVQVAIIGTGFSGLCMAIKLLEAGITNFVLLEKKDQIGGTWRDNTYPGCACDVQSHLYSYSFEGNPEWSKVFSGWKEIQDYTLGCAEKYGLNKYVRTNFEVKSAVFDETQGVWTLTSVDGHQVKTQTFVMGTGPLHVPAIPNLPGLDSFKGEVFHSAEWNHDFNMKGKKVASIGTGGSAIQYVPEIAPEVDQLYVYQRTPAWVLPRNERAYTGVEKWMFRNVPGARKMYRSMLYWMNESRLLPILHPKMANLLSKLAKLHIRKYIKDPELREKLTPNYTIGCKRILISNRYLPTFNRSNVELVTDGIQSIGEDHIVTRDGKKREVDAIILGTGFHADPRNYMKNFTIQGKDGMKLLDAWKEGAEAYFGITVKGFPNMFQLVGPNTGLGHNSVIFMIESQVHYVIECLKKMKAKNAQTLEVKPDVQAGFNEWVQAGLKNTVWSSGCASWYLQDDGKNFTIWPGSTWSYRLKTRNVPDQSFYWKALSELPSKATAQASDQLSVSDQTAPLAATK
ncbi:flavin-containing monooxygenase [Litoribrevibacter albus]|uniref:4-hydroxyacetophenone monooxygenase n=1 Tax=Litoribrevibacter albus TaxID=1473156 RepID=A0AA37W8H4_9GAMM|nr:NAD(P)/FAD-dependent oxidoreductase [Litoribrevibacter albus]GLQ32024.1 4-hydroxyacetophenone monooxygenase [Litoribrevibacter albus]